MDLEVEASIAERLPPKGVYTLVIFLSNETRLIVGKLGAQRFPKGYYAYSGSALGVGASGMRNRVLRHLRKEKRSFWHIDFLTAHRNATIKVVVAAQTDRKRECKINRSIAKGLGRNVPVNGFGSSDCKEGCKAHLLYLDGRDPTSKIAKVYEMEMGRSPALLILKQVPMSKKAQCRLVACIKQGYTR